MKMSIQNDNHIGYDRVYPPPLSSVPTASPPSQQVPDNRNQQINLNKEAASISLIPSAISFPMQQLQVSLTVDKMRKLGLDGPDFEEKTCAPESNLLFRRPFGCSSHHNHQRIAMILSNYRVQIPLSVSGAANDGISLTVFGVRFSDKTITLTRNLMGFFKRSIGEETYGNGVTQLELGE
ncbi:hypothetical protein LXL04_008588 [Taraxacum kok-saghyz]